TDSRTRALTLARLAHVLHADAPHTDRRAIADEAEAMARRLDAPVVLASVLGARVLAVDGPDDLDEHRDIGAEGTRTRAQTGDLAPGRTVVDDSQAGPASLAWALLDAWVAAGAGDVEAARARLAEHPAAALADEDAGYLWMAAVVGAAVVASSVGDRAWAEAARTALVPYAGRNALMGYAAYLGGVDHHLGTVETVLGQ